MVCVCCCAECVFGVARYEEHAEYIAAAYRGVNTVLEGSSECTEAQGKKSNKKKKEGD